MVLQPGEQFDHYVIQSHLAEGGIGDVYRAMESQTGQVVALKIPSRATIVNPAQYDYYLREVDALRLLQNEAVQCFVESGRFDGTPYLVTGLIEGTSLRQVIKDSGSFSIDRALALIRKIAAAVGYCHAQGVIHRDLKPENIIMTGSDQPVLLDFSLALSKNHRFPGKAAGTPEYVAPEQVEGRQCDERTDIYALGILLFEMITGRPPFTGDDVALVATLRLHEAVPRLDKLRSDVPLAIATIVAKCLQRDPEGRYPQVQALIHDLDHPDQVDTSTLEALCAPPPKPTFFQTQPGQAILTTAAFILGIALLTIFLLALKR